MDEPRGGGGEAVVQARLRREVLPERAGEARHRGEEGATFAQALLRAAVAQQQFEAQVGADDGVGGRDFRPRAGGVARGAEVRFQLTE